MKDSHIGAMGVIAIVCVLLVKFAVAGLAAGRHAVAGRAADAAGRAMRRSSSTWPSCPTPGPTDWAPSSTADRPRWAAVWAAGVLAAAASGFLGLAGPGRRGPFAWP